MDPTDPDEPRRKPPNHQNIPPHFHQFICNSESTNTSNSVFCHTSPIDSNLSSPEYLQPEEPLRRAQDTNLSVVHPTQPLNVQPPQIFGQTADCSHVNEPLQALYSTAPQSGKAESIPSSACNVPITQPGLFSLESGQENKVDASIGRITTYSENGISVSLHQSDLWESFYKESNEMIVTMTGSGLIPLLEISLDGLKDDVQYDVALQIEAVDNLCYKYVNGGWVATASDVIQDTDRQIYRHPDSPKIGALWMIRGINFKLCKIIHKIFSNSGHILLHPWHKYVMKIVVTENCPAMTKTAIKLELTEFIAVTHYRHLIIALLKANYELLVMASWA